MNKQIQDILLDVDAIKDSADKYEVHFLKQRIEIACKALQGSNIDYDKGPWSVCENESQVYLHSDDFTHDVTLRVSGDFYDEQAKITYAKKLADQLNKSTSPRLTYILPEVDPNAKLYDQKTMDSIIEMYTRNRNVTWSLEYSNNSGIGTGVDLVFSDGKRYNITNYDIW